MKILFTNDWHLTDKRPLNRVDLDFFETQFRKVEEILKIAKEHAVERIYHGGDWTDSPRVSLSTVNELLRILKPNTIPILTVIGNHDLEGYNLNSVTRGALGTLLRSGVVMLLNKSSGLHITTEHTVEKYKAMESEIIVTHNLVSPTKVMYDHILCDTLSPYVKNKIVLCGHKHMNFLYNNSRDNCLMVNTGCLVRTAVNESSHKPYVVIIDTITRDVKKVFLQAAKDGKEVFDLASHEDAEKKSFNIDTFVNELKTTKFSGSDVESVFTEFIKDKKISKDVLDEAYSRIREG